jgi:hypothetical protein
MSSVRQSRARLHEGEAGMSKSLYAIAAESLKNNEEQLRAYESEGNCAYSPALAPAKPKR